MRADRSHLSALLRSAKEPTGEQLARFEAYLREHYKREVPVSWEMDPEVPVGFRMQVGSDVYDWTPQGTFRQFRDHLLNVREGENDILPLMQEAVDNWRPSAEPEEMGEVLAVDSEVATISGLAHARYGEILTFPSGVKGMIQDLRKDDLSCVLFGDSGEVAAGDMVRRTDRKSVV